MTTSPSTASGRAFAALAIALTGALLLSGCFVLRQDQEFAIGTESNRANLVIHRTYSASLDRDLIHGHGVQVARDVVLAASPSSFSLSGVYGRICWLNPALCIGVYALAHTVMSWWRSDVRGRGDFHEAMHEARVENKCFAWTFVAGSGRNFTVKPRGNSGCR